MLGEIFRDEYGYRINFFSGAAACYPHANCFFIFCENFRQDFLFQSSKSVLVSEKASDANKELPIEGLFFFI